MRDECEHENHRGAYECPQQLAMSEVNKRAPCGSRPSPHKPNRRRFELLQVRPARVGGQHLVIHTDRAEGPAQTHQRIEVEKFN
jgi:hypothetical protein